MQSEKELQLETKKTSKLVWDYGLPAIVGMMVHAVYNIADRIFIGQGVGALAISGLSITFPVSALMAALGMLVGIGSASRISISLGRRDKETAERILGNAFTLTVLFNIIFISLLLIFLKPILMQFGASEATYPYAREYLNIVIPGNIFVTMTYSFNNMMRASGYPQKAMYTMLIGAALNLILDPIFIYWFDWGIAGAAYATLISMFIGTLFVMYHFVNKESYIRLRKRNFKLNKRITTYILSIGLSPFIMHVTASGVAVLMNTSLKRYGGDLAIGAFGILNSILLLVVMFIVGLNQGMQPIIGYNYGAQKYDRVQSTLYYGLKVATLITTAGFLFAMFFPRMFAMAFTSDETLLQITEQAIRIGMAAFPLVGFQIVISNFFQSIGQAKISIIQSLSRQVLFLIPGIILFPRLWDLNGLWIAMPVSDTMAALLSLYFFMQQVKKFRFLNARKK